MCCRALIRDSNMLYSSFTKFCIWYSKIHSTYEVLFIVFAYQVGHTINYNYYLEGCGVFFQHLEGSFVKDNTCTWT